VDEDGDLVVPRRKLRSAIGGLELDAECFLFVCFLLFSCVLYLFCLFTLLFAGFYFFLLSISFSLVDTISIVHQMDTPIASVGLQVWSGSLLLADYILALHQRDGMVDGDGRRAERCDFLRDRAVIELGCGCGFAGLVASRYARAQRPMFLLIVCFG
jgi:hypothetical protein